MNFILISLIVIYLIYDKRYDMLDAKDSILDFIDFRISGPIKKRVGQIHLFSNIPLQKLQWAGTASFTTSFGLSSASNISFNSLSGTFLAHNGATWVPTTLNNSISDLTDEVEEIKLENSELKKKIVELETKINYLVDKEGEI